jgi:hypothetical protein
MIGYQRYLYMRGTMLGMLMLIGLGGIVVSWRGGGLRRRRNWGGPALFPWVAALTMEVVPPATADFSLRYVVPTIPVICITAALAFARPLRGGDDTVVAAAAGPQAAVPGAPVVPGEPVVPGQTVVPGQAQAPAAELPDLAAADAAAAGGTSGGPESTGRGGTAAS